jgi:hypothetical protein
LYPQRIKGANRDADWMRRAVVVPKSQSFSGIAIKPPISVAIYGPRIAFSCCGR